MTVNKLFLDFDGTLVDFDARAVEIFGMPAHEYEKQNGAKQFWREIRHYRSTDDLGFFESLDLMNDAHILINGVEHLNPTILTGCPFGNWAAPQKVRSAAKLCPKFPIITCMAKDKFQHMRPGDVLIDDREKHRAAWEDAGGIWITHTSAASSLSQLWEAKPEWKE